LHLKSYDDGDAVIAEWTPGINHRSFPGVLNGGIIGTLLDCHSNWAAAMHLLHSRGEFAMTVTAEYSIRLHRPTSPDEPVRLRSWVTKLEGRRAAVEATLSSNGDVTASSTGTFVIPRGPMEGLPGAR
jgi:acyl-coenzyme A thioesterase PaaI-like protein